MTAGRQATGATTTFCHRTRRSQFFGSRSVPASCDIAGPCPYQGRNPGTTVSVFELLALHIGVPQWTSVCCSTTAFRAARPLWQQRAGLGGSSTWSMSPSTERRAFGRSWSLSSTEVSPARVCSRSAASLSSPCPCSSAGGGAFLQASSSACALAGMSMLPRGLVSGSFGEDDSEGSETSMMVSEERLRTKRVFFILGI